MSLHQHAPPSRSPVITGIGATATGAVTRVTSLLAHAAGAAGGLGVPGPSQPSSRAAPPAWHGRAAPTAERELVHTKGADRICVSCFDRSSRTTAVCGTCGRHGPIKTHGPDGAPRCQACQQKSRRTACAGCGRVRPFNVSKADGKPYCRGCRARNSLTPISSRHPARDSD